MEVADAIELRRSVRRYKDREVPEGMLKAILRAGHMAPSAGNMQGRDFIVVRDRNVRESISSAALGQRFITEAPVCIVVCANVASLVVPLWQTRELYAVQDSAASAMNMILMAHDLGLGTCWVGAFNESAVSQLLDMPAGVRPVALITIGYPDESPDMPPRMGEKIEHRGKW